MRSGMRNGNDIAQGKYQQKRKCEMSGLGNHVSRVSVKAVCSTSDFGVGFARIIHYKLHYINFVTICFISVNTNPTWYFFPTAVQVLIESFVLGLEFPHQPPEAHRMIHVLRMAELVDHHIAQVRRLQEQQTIIETDRAGTGVTAPTGALAANVHFQE